MTRIVLVVEVVATAGEPDPLTAPLDQLTEGAGRALAHEAGRELARALQKVMAGSTVLERRGVWLLSGPDAFRVLEVVPPRY